DGPGRTFRFASAGHATGYLLGADGRVKRRLDSTGMPLAVLPDAEFAAADPVPVDEGDLIVLVTDGLIEATHDDGSPLRIERALNGVRANRHEPARAIVSAVYQAVRDGCRDQRQHDDMTAIVLKAETDPVTQTSQALIDTVPDFALEPLAVPTAV